MPQPVSDHDSAEPQAVSADALFAAVYARLKAMASRHLVRNDAGTLNTTALVHELYLRVCVGRELSFSDEAQFFSYAAQAMRHILVDRSRQRVRLRRGGGLDNVELSAAEHVADATAENTIELDDALRVLERDAPRSAQLVALHYFAGLPLDKIAELLHVTERTLNRDWRFARAFLHDILDT
jgi:RNA polymerase sigma factor (TIGR02999 family)